MDHNPLRRRLSKRITSVGRRFTLTAPVDVPDTQPDVPETQPDIPETPAAPMLTLTSPSPPPQSPPSQSPPPQSPPMPTRTVTPGPNAFAQQAARVDKHRLQSNAFYQQEVQRRMQNLPTAVHPALREGFDINAPVDRIPGSPYTTMSPFLGGTAQTPPTPPVLLPQDCFQAYPTDRGFIEEKREQLEHKNSGSDTERTPVFIPTPNIESSEFSRSNSYSTPKKKVSVQDRAAAIEQTKTLKKGFLEKLRFSTPRSSQATASSSSLSTSRGYGVFGGGETLPPKAKAVLSSPPHKSNLTRAPSKRKGIFSFKASERPSLETHKSSPASVPSEPRSAGARTVRFSDSTAKTPQTAHTAHSDQTYDRWTSAHMEAQRAFSQPHADKAGRKIPEQNKESSACGVSRTRSLQYIDRTMPPTPPAKNTPPHEKETKSQREARLREDSRAILEHHRLVTEQRRLEVMRDITPKKEMVQDPESKLKSPLRQGMLEDTPTREMAKLVGADGRTSPTKTGSFGRKEVPKLVKQPSVYSMHASFYPDLDDQYSFEEVKRRADGLGLEGLSELPESFYKSDPKVSYSPSLYSEDFGSIRPGVLQSSPSMLHQMDIAQYSPSPLAISEKFQPMRAKGLLSEKPSASSQGTIPLVYPELASDPSRSDLRESLQAHHRSTSEVQLPVHSRKQSLARSQSTSRGQSSSRSRSPHKSSLQVMVKTLEEEITPLSPPNYSCPSAMPSPLHFLPNTTYTPQRNLKLNVDIAPESPSSTSTKTLTPSRSRGRIETFKSTGSPIARIPTTPYDQLPTLSPGIKPKFDALPFTAELDEQPEPQEQDHGSPSDARSTEPANDQKDEEDEPQQEVSAADPRTQPLLDTIREQQALIARIKADFEAKCAELSKRNDEIMARNAEITARYSRQNKPPTPGLSATADSDIGYASSTSNMSIGEPAEQNEAIAPFVEEGSLAQMGLYHRVQQQRVDQEYDDVQIAELERHEQADGKSKREKEAPTMGELMGMMESLAKEVRQMQASRQEK